MYSRYSGISIPKNYGGSRFSNISEPETKAHRGELGGATRSAHSPSFSKIASVFEPSKPEENPIENELSGYEDELEDNYTPELDESDIAEPDSEAKEQEHDESAECGIKNERGFPFELSSIKDLFSHIDKEELIIIGLILLLMTDGSQKNDDIVVLLVLLLFNGKM